LEEEQRTAEGLKNEQRLRAIDDALRERKDMTGAVSAIQVIKLAQFQRVQDRMIRMKRVKWYILDPHATGMQIWDAVTAFALIFTAIVTPLEVAFFPAPFCADEAMFIINRLVDSMFLIDMFLQVRSAPPRHRRTPGAAPPPPPHPAPPPLRAVLPLASRQDECGSQRLGDAAERHRDAVHAWLVLDGPGVDLPLGLRHHPRHR
jgi:hypothetical protein